MLLHSVLPLSVVAVLPCVSAVYNVCFC